MRRPIRRLRRNGRPPARSRLILPGHEAGRRSYEDDDDEEDDYEEESALFANLEVERRHTRFLATGVLNAEGEMLVRAIVPVKCRMGFQTPGRDKEVTDEVTMILTESEVHAAGHDLAYVDYREVADD